MEARKLHQPDTFPVTNQYKRKSGKILRRFEHSSWLLNRKALSYGRLKICKITRVAWKTVKCDWRAKCVLPIQIRIS